MDKHRRRIRAVIDNDVVALRNLCDPPDWCDYIDPETGNTLLHFAVSTMDCSEELFRYLLSFDRIPLNHKNNDDLSVLIICLAEWSRANDVFAYELIKRGACPPDSLFCGETTLLHYTAKNLFVGVSVLLMQMGYDVNACNADGVTPIWVCLRMRSSNKTEETEIVIALLCFGADPWQGQYIRNLEYTPPYNYNAFEHSVKFYYQHTVREALFYYMIDEYTVMDVHIEVLLTLADERSPLFLDTVKHVGDVIVGDYCREYYHLFFTINDSDLAALIQKCPDAIRRVFYKVLDTTYVHTVKRCGKMSLQNVNLLLESDDLRDATMDFISHRLNAGGLNDETDFYSLIGFAVDESTVIENVCFLLLHGLTLNQSNLRAFYKRYGFGDLLKILLYIDIEPKPEKIREDPLLLLRFDVSWNLQKILENLNTLEKVEDLLPYFAHAAIRAFCSNDARTEVVAAIARQPDVPLLVELARNVFRGHFVKTFAINNAPRFYALLDKLPILHVYKKIITLEKKLY